MLGEEGSHPKEILSPFGTQNDDERKFPMDIIQKTEKILKENRLVAYGEKVIVGVSGGPDSTALLYILNTLRNKLGLRLQVVHVNHQLRKSAQRDALFVARLCENLHLPYTMKRVQIKTSSAKSSLEEAAREKRFECLLHLAKQEKASVIALGHTKDDLAETVLMRILRGTGLLGLQGIAPSKQMQDITIVRPLIQFSKKEILAYLAAKKIKFCVDPTNRQTHFFRNKIRLELLPLLKKEYQSNLPEILANLANSTATDYDYLKKVARTNLNKLARFKKNKKQMSLSLPKLNQLHPALQRLVIRLAIQELKGNLNQFSLIHMKEIENLIRHRPDRSRVDLPHALTAQKNKSTLTLAVRNT